MRPSDPHNPLCSEKALITFRIETGLKTIGRLALSRRGALHESGPKWFILRETARLRRASVEGHVVVAFDVEAVRPPLPYHTSLENNQLKDHRRILLTIEFVTNDRGCRNVPSYWLHFGCGLRRAQPRPLHVLDLTFTAGTSAPHQQRPHAAYLVLQHTLRLPASYTQSLPS